MTLPTPADQPRNLPHTFTIFPLQNHFQQSPTPPEAIRLIDLEPGTFLDTEEEINVIAASLWVLSLRYDGLGEKSRASDREELRKWIMKHRNEVVGNLAGKVEPPFSAWSIDQMQRDVGVMMEELLLKTLPPQQKDEGKKGK